MEERGFLRSDEPHPSAKLAFEWIKNMPMIELQRWFESFNSVAISGNRLAEVCAETLRRLLHKEAVSDRYLLGLAWAMRFDQMDLKKRKEK